MKDQKFYVENAKKALLASPTAVQSLKLFSASKEDLACRINAYSNALGFTSMLEDRALQAGAKRGVIMNFAATGNAPGMGAANLRGTTIYPATILSYVSSIAPIFAVERSMDTPMADLQFMDFYNLIDGSSVLPNLGQDVVFGKNELRKNLSSTIDGTVKEFSYLPAVSIIPKSIEITYVSADKTIEVIEDNGNGKLLCTPGLLTAGTVNYKTGAVSMTFATAPATGAILNFLAAQDTPTEDEVQKLGGENKYFHVTTEPIIIPIQRNIISDAAMNKQGVIDPNVLYSNVIQTEYTKLINEKVVAAIVNNYDGDTYKADLSSFNLAAGRYDTFIRTFQSLLVNGKTLLGEKTYKTCEVTGILAGAQISNVFQYMTAGEGWTPNDQLGYFKDLIGWYKSIPVVRWTASESNVAQVADDEIYLTHRTKDGQLAPTVRGMFITPTDIPEIANFKNPTQITNGMFSLEGVRPTSSKLTVKMKITLPTSQVLTKA